PITTRLWSFVSPGTSSCRRGGGIGGGTRRAQTGEPIHVTPSSKARRPCHCQRAAQMAEQRQISRHAHVVTRWAPAGLLQRDQRRPCEGASTYPDGPADLVGLESSKEQRNTGVDRSKSRLRSALRPRAAEALQLDARGCANLCRFTQLRQRG